ncbi:MAG: hypothetical protein COA79_15235 [Planctomycetota bacterium]|nr:MAG: hypothetical protein COA79_15235 [Planctomycetota bacterium]
MKLLFARHGDSLNIGQGGITRDHERILSTSGKKEISQIARGLKSNNIVPSVIFSSPFKRTIETSNIFAKEFGTDTSVEVAEAIQSGARYDDYIEVIEEFSLWEKYQDQTIMFVGHAPDVGRVCDVFASIKGLYFNTGTVAQIELPIKGSMGTLIGYWTPDLFLSE